MAQCSLIANTYELREVLQMFNPLCLAAAKKFLPWYVRIFDSGAYLKIKVFRPEIVFE
jgi:hypothetical protein